MPALAGERLNARMSWLAAAPPEDFHLGEIALRRLRQEDRPVLVRLVNENLDHLRPWMPWAQSPMTDADEAAFLLQMDRAWEERAAFVYAVTAGGVIIGSVGLHTRPEAGVMEIGYWISATHINRGHATAASRALTEAAFGLPDVGEVVIRCDRDNRASAAVPAKLGYRLDGVEERNQIWRIAKPVSDRAG